MLPEYYKRYQLIALAGAPEVLSALLDHPEDSHLWDLLHEPERFTLRESLAHLADWEPVARGRILKCLAEDKPFLTNWDEDQAAIDGGYYKLSPLESLEVFAKERQETVAVVSALKDEEWARPGVREGVGELSIERQVNLIIAHDGYHFKQVVDLLKHSGA
jgi:hypothetical protein